MGFCVSQLTTQTLMDIQSDCEYQLQLITNTLQRLASEDASIVQQQTACSQAYLNANVDAEGAPTEAAIEYVNSAAFNSTFNAKLKEIQAKEQQLDIQKQQIETRQKMYSTQRDSKQKTTQSNVEKTIKYD